MGLLCFPLACAHLVSQFVVLHQILDLPFVDPDIKLQSALRHFRKCKVVVIQHVRDAGVKQFAVEAAEKLSPLQLPNRWFVRGVLFHTAILPPVFSPVYACQLASQR